MRRVTKPRRVTYDAPRALTCNEYLKLNGSIRNEKFSDIVDFYLLTGIRRSDGLRITSENFDFERMVATLPQHKQGTHKTIPIGVDLASVVHRMVSRVGGGKPLVQLHPSRLTDNFRAARKRAGLPLSPSTPCVIRSPRGSPHLEPISRPCRN